MKRVACIIPNYNMSERASNLYNYVKGVDAEIIVVNNGGSPNNMDAVYLDDNIQTTGAWLMGMYYADALERKYDQVFDYYWLIITSAEFISDVDVLSPMVEFMDSHSEVVGCHPSLSADSTTSWEHMKTVGSGFREVKMIDNICALWRADWFTAIGRFDPRLRYAWGIDLETSYLARKMGKGIYICDDVQVKK